MKLKFEGGEVGTTGFVKSHNGATPTTITSDVDGFEARRAIVLERAALELEVMKRDLQWSRDQRRALTAAAARLRELKRESWR